MPYTADPREQLVQTGAQLLDILYAEHQWEQRFPDIAAALRARKQGDDPDVTAITNSPDFIDAFLSSMNIASERHRLIQEYFLLRSTIEALDQPRPPMPGL